MTAPVQEWQVGERVASRPEFAHLYEGTSWAQKLALPRMGTIIEVPWATRNVGEGTVLVDWDSLTGEKGEPKNWQRWMWTGFIGKTVTDQSNEKAMS